jgi:ketosteroid isomerase-like protein
MTKQDQIIECENRLLTAFKNKDIEVVDELLHDDLLFVIPDGQIVSKAMDLANLRSGVMKINDINASEQQICIIDDIATVAVTIHLSATYAGNSINHKYRYLRVWKLVNNAWKVIAGSGFQIQ